MQRSLSFVLALTLYATPCFAQYSFQVIDFPKAASTYVYAINDLGQYVGAYTDNAGLTHAVAFDGRKLSALDPNGVVGKSTNASAYSINNLGEIVGSYYDSDNHPHGFVSRLGHLSTLDFPGAEGTQAYGINDLGEIIGVYKSSDGHGHAYTLRDGRFHTTDLTGGVTTPLSINDKGETVGEFAPDPTLIGHGFRTQPSGASTTYDAPGSGADSTYFLSINNRDQIVGFYLDVDSNYYNFILTNGKQTPFDVPASFNASFVSAQTINDLDAVVGWFSDAAGNNHGFVARH